MPKILVECLNIDHWKYLTRGTTRTIHKHIFCKFLFIFCCSCIKFTWYVSEEKFCDNEVHGQLPPIQHQSYYNEMRYIIIYIVHTCMQSLMSLPHPKQFEILLFVGSLCVFLLRFTLIEWHNVNVLWIALVLSLHGLTSWDPFAWCPCGSSSLVEKVHLCVEQALAQIMGAWDMNRLSCF